MRTLITCKECKQVKRLEGHGLCKKCYNVQWRQKNKVRILTIARIWKKKNREHLRKKQRIWAENNPKKIKLNAKNYREKYPNRLIKSRKKRREENPIEYKAQARTECLKKKYKIKRNGNCLKCNKLTKGLIAHHISYKPNISIYGFCSKCHKEIHMEVCEDGNNISKRI